MSETTDIYTPVVCIVTTVQSCVQLLYTKLYSYIIRKTCYLRVSVEYRVYKALSFIIYFVGVATVTGQRVR